MSSDGGKTLLFSKKRKKKKKKLVSNSYLMEASHHAERKPRNHMERHCIGIQANSFYRVPSQQPAPTARPVSKETFRRSQPTMLATVLSPELPQVWLLNSHHLVYRLTVP